jgi:hypothetical protein
MDPAMQRTGSRCQKLAPSVVALALAAIIGGAPTAPAHAQNYDGNRGREMYRDHDNRHHGRDRDRYETRSYRSPAYVYAPPPVYYYAPPPPPPVIDLVFPLRFR